MRRGWAPLLFVVLASGCAPGLDFRAVRERPKAGDAATDAHSDATTDAMPDAARDRPDAPDARPDAPPPDAAVDAPRADAARHDAEPLEDATIEDATIEDAGGEPLSPLLSLPGPDGAPCTRPGLNPECPSVHSCRFVDTEGGRCESCDECRGVDQYCERSFDCDILFVCFDHRCTAPCLLGTYQCGPIEDCWDIGHPEYGVCAPF